MRAHPVPAQGDDGHDDRKRDAMHPTDPKPLGDYFEEGVQARLDGKGLHDNPYAAGSAKRREWNAGYCATVDDEDGPRVHIDGTPRRARE